MNAFTLLVYAMIASSLALSAWFIIDARRYKIRRKAILFKKNPVNAVHIFESLHVTEPRHLKLEAAVIVETANETSFVGIYDMRKLENISLDVDLEKVEQEVRKILRDAKTVTKQKREHRLLSE